MVLSALWGQLKKVILTSISLLFFTSLISLNAQWAKTYGGSVYDNSNSIQQTSDGGYIVFGHTSPRSFSGWDYWVLKLDSSGNIEWQRTYGGSDREYGWSVQQTNDGGFIIAGNMESDWERKSFILKLTSIGDIEWQRTYGWGAEECVWIIQQCNDGGYICAGAKGALIYGPADFWLVKLYSNGEIKWQKTYGGSRHDKAYSVRQTEEGGYIVCGYTYSFVDWYVFFILKLYSDGSISQNCSLIRDSNVKVSITDLTPVETNITPQDTNLLPHNTNCIPQSSEVIVQTICESPLYTLNVSTSIGGTTDPTPGSYKYYDKINVLVKTVPETGYEFSCWSGDVSSGLEKSNTLTILMDSNKSIKANFKIKRSNSDGKKKKPCFIATAAYGSPLYPSLKALQESRDKYLMRNKIGRKLVDLYYKYSPFVADFITKHKVLRTAVRIWLIHIVVFGYSIVNFGPYKTIIVLALILAIPFFFVWFYRRRSQRDWCEWKPKTLKPWLPWIEKRR